VKIFIKIYVGDIDHRNNKELLKFYIFIKENQTENEINKFNILYIISV